MVRGGWKLNWEKKKFSWTVSKGSKVQGCSSAAHTHQHSLVFFLPRFTFSSCCERNVSDTKCAVILTPSWALFQRSESFLRSLAYGALGSKCPWWMWRLSNIHSSIADVSSAGFRYRQWKRRSDWKFMKFRTAKSRAPSLQTRAINFPFFLFFTYRPKKSLTDWRQSPSSQQTIWHWTFTPRSSSARTRREIRRNLKLKLF